MYHESQPTEILAFAQVFGTRQSNKPWHACPGGFWKALVEDKNINASITRVNIKNVGKRWFIRVGDLSLGGYSSTVEQIKAEVEPPSRLRTLTRKLSRDIELIGELIGDGSDDESNSVT